MEFHNLSDPLPEEELAPVTTLFNAWVRRSPLETALRQKDRTLTYAELSCRAHGVALALRKEGCVSGEVVAIDGRPGFGLIASLLGTLLAGGVALMIDRRLPVERRRLMCREAEAKHLVWLSTDEWWADHRFSSIVSVDPATGKVALPTDVQGQGSELQEPSAQDGAYVFFTSGMTGVPKGVLGTHRGLSHFIMWQRLTFGVGPGDRSSQLTGLSFDVVLREIFLPLTSGAALCIPDDPEELGAEHVLPWLEREKITILHTVPALAATWLAALPQKVSLRFLRQVFFAGEPLGGRLVQRWRSAFGTSAGIVNLYGPTETTLAKCYYIVPDEPGEGVQPVGQPLPHSQALVLAEDGGILSAGEWGEIVIRTPYRTMGYINVPEENRRRFRPNPFRSDDRDLFYYTGDHGRFRADGMLEISGRIDDQVKINGVIVEPAEIAAVLNQYPGVQHSTVLGRTETSTGVRLFAYVQPKKNSHLSPAQLRNFLRTKFPEYMVPASFVLLDRLPLTSNGKVDRQALSDIEVAQTVRTESASALTPTEELLAGIWAETLGVETVGVEDNFFDLGGNSLSTMQVMTRARLLGLELTNVTMFRYPNVRSLARHLSGEGSSSPTYEGVRVRAQRQTEALARQEINLRRR